MAILEGAVSRCPVKGPVMVVAYLVVLAHSSSGLIKSICHASRICLPRAHVLHGSFAEFCLGAKGIVIYHFG